MIKKYRHLLFDLDKTIWDFDRNSESTIREIYAMLGLKAKGIEDFEEFHRIYEQHNLKLWDLYRRDKIVKEDLMVKRFADALIDFGVDEPDTAQLFSNRYLEILPSRTCVFPGTYEVLDYLSGKYTLHIITNGFSEVQYTKLNNAGMDKYFSQVITSEDAGAKKPDKAIFGYALNLIGAKLAGIDQVYFNPNRKEHQEELTFEIFSMRGLMEIL